MNILKQRILCEYASGNQDLIVFLQSTMIDLLTKQIITHGFVTVSFTKQDIQMYVEDDFDMWDLYVIAKALDYDVVLREERIVFKY